MKKMYDDILPPPGPTNTSAISASGRRPAFGACADVRRFTTIHPQEMLLPTLRTHYMYK